jgi:hypothetical protein
MNFITDTKINKNLTLLLPLNQETLTSYLSPILGQFNIKNNEFLKQFILDFNNFTNFIFKEAFSDFLNDKSKILADLDLIIPLNLIIFFNNKYQIIFKLPSVNTLLNFLFIELNLYNNSSKYLYYLSLYKIAFLKSILINYGFNNKMIKGNYFQIRHYLKKKIKKFKIKI